MKIDYKRYKTGELMSILAGAKRVADRIQNESCDGESLSQEHNRIERALARMCWPSTDTITLIGRKR
jgi:hypothetical protein